MIPYKIKRVELLFVVSLSINLFMMSLNHQKQETTLFCSRMIVLIKNNIIKYDGNNNKIIITITTYNSNNL